MTRINEGLQFRDLEGMMKPTLHIDEFKSKVGQDDAYVVLSFFVQSERVADDLVHWFENGYQYVIDADKSEGEIDINRYLVFVEIDRRTYMIEQIKELLEDLETLTGFDLMDWDIRYEDTDYKFDEETLKNVLILSPQKYREIKEFDLNEMRQASGLPIKPVYNATDEDMNAFRTLANLPVKK